MTVAACSSGICTEGGRSAGATPMSSQAPESLTSHSFQNTNVEAHGSADRAGRWQLFVYGGRGQVFAWLVDKLVGALFGSPIHYHQARPPRPLRLPDLGSFGEPASSQFPISSAKRFQTRTGLPRSSLSYLGPLSICLRSRTLFSFSRTLDDAKRPGDTIRIARARKMLKAETAYFRKTYRTAHS